QVVHAEVEWKMVEEDVSHLEAEEREERLEAIGREERERGFDLGEAPLLRVRLVKVGEEERRLLGGVDPLLRDARAVRGRMREWERRDGERRQGRKAGLRGRGGQYGDYAEWQREWLGGEELKREVEYWRRELEGAEPLEVSTDGVRPAVASYGGGEERFVVS